MFKRIIIEEWHSIMPVAGFILTSGTFIVLTVRAMLMKRSDLDSMSTLPLETAEKTKEAL